MKKPSGMRKNRYLLAKQSLLRVQSAWDTTSFRTCGVRGYLAAWLQSPEICGTVLRKSQAHLNVLLEFKQERK